MVAAEKITFYHDLSLRFAYKIPVFANFGRSLVQVG